MHTNRSHEFAAIPIAIFLIFAARPSAAGSHSHTERTGDIETSTTVDDPRTCSDIRVRFADRDAVRAEERLNGPGPSGPLSLTLPTNAGAFIRGADRRDWAILACKAADSDAALAGVHVTFEKGELRTRGPEGTSNNWLVYYLIEGPRGAQIDGTTHNGPLQFAGLAGGRIRARAENGPISLRDCSGTIDAEAKNGPISLERVSGVVSARADNGPISLLASSGNVKMETQNGPISVRLTGDSWRDGTLDAHAVNGPLSLRIPGGYRSGTVVESTGHSPWQCRGGACDSARRTGDDESRRIAFGEAKPVVRLSTVNGPVSIDSTRSE